MKTIFTDPFVWFIIAYIVVVNIYGQWLWTQKKRIIRNTKYKRRLKSLKKIQSTLR